MKTTYIELNTPFTNQIYFFFFSTFTCLRMTTDQKASRTENAKNMESTQVMIISDQNLSIELLGKMLLSKPCGLQSVKVLGFLRIIFS